MIEQETGERNFYLKRFVLLAEYPEIYFRNYSRGKINKL